MNNLPKIIDFSPFMGCDPELFFSKHGEIIGAEKVLSAKKVDSVIIDGVQVELNPPPSFCRALLASNIRTSMHVLKREMENKGVSLDFSRTITISKERLMELSDDSRRLGCAPSETVYENTSALKLNTINPEDYRVRSAGGHIHIGMNGTTKEKEVEYALRKDTKRTVELLDIICGVPSILLDQDPSNAERRKLYGRAGEYRLPAHGLEYRTLSNYWLTSYPLMSFAFGMARLAIQIMSHHERDVIYKAITERVDPKVAAKVINENDVELAADIFIAIQDILVDILPKEQASTGRYPLHRYNLDQFYHFVDMVVEEGMGYWFNEDPLTHWTKTEPSYSPKYMGFNDFLRVHVQKDIDSRKKTA